MDEQVAAIIASIEALDASQKAQLMRALSGFTETGRLDERVKKDAGLIMGPLGGICPYCGK